MHSRGNAFRLAVGMRTDSTCLGAPMLGGSRATAMWQRAGRCTGEKAISPRGISLGCVMITRSLTPPTPPGLAHV
jgi:hypothetical protein